MKPSGKASTVLAAALAAAFGPALAADEEPSVAQLKAPESEASVGIGAVSDDNQRFGQYNGLNEKGGYLLLDADVVRRNDDTGTWLRFSGRNLGLDSRELRFGQERQGDWGYFIDFSQIPRFDPYTVNTGLQGIGTTNQAQRLITPGGGSEYHLSTERQRWTLGANKTLLPGLSADLKYRTEEKKGDRLWGQGTFGNWRFLADPIDQTTNQVDATLAYSAGRLQLTGGYYGTTFENRNNVLNVTNVAPLGAPPFTQMSLPPDNQSHQLHLAGGYNFTPTARGTFKLAVGRITQDEAFATSKVAGAPGSLGGRIDTTLAQAGFTAKPLPKLSVRADLRYEDRDDKTPTFIYYPSQRTPTSTNNGENEPRDIKTLSGKLDASYQLPNAFKLNGGVEYVEKKRNSPPVRSVGFRETTEETSLSVGLRRAIGETMTGAVSYLHGERTGSEFLTNVNFGGTLYSNAIAPLHLADRERDTLRATLNWAPAERLALNLRADLSQDKYTGRTTTGFELGPRKGEGQLFSLDGAYSFSERVQATAWVSQAKNRYENATCPESGAPLTCTNSAASPVWGDKLTNTDTSFGLGLRSQLTAQLMVSADFTQSEVRDEMNTFAISPAGALPGGALAVLPDINTKVTTFKLRGDYALRKNMGIRAEWIHDQYRTDDWTWANWVYNDGTTVTQNPNQKVDFFGVAIYVRL
jgi:MtrB/PioB family decaheme-associated outer membrane protein